MENYDEQFDDVESKLRSDFSADLKGLLQPPNSVPQAIDKKIIAMAQAKFSKKPHYKILRWLAPLAAAAVIIVAVSLNMPKQVSKKAVTENKAITLQTPMAKLPDRSVAISGEDIDKDGSVDILDAMKLDMKIKNADAGPEYDFNKDGVVNKKDVDMVAFYAVRINKGVL